MARLSNRSRIEQLLDEWEPAMKAAFLASIDDVASNAAMALIAERLKAGDIEGAMRAVNLDPAAFRPLDGAIAQAYEAGGVAAVRGFPRLNDTDGARLVFRFGVRNRHAESWLSLHSSTLVTRITADQQAMLRNVLTDALAGGRNPRSTALDIVGRIDAVTGRRVGGLLGLTEAQAAAVAKARTELLSGDPAQLQAYLGRARRDRRFDKAVLTAIKHNKPIDAGTVAKMLGRYTDRQLQLRGEMIARTETMAALGQAQDEAMRQAIEAGKVDAGTVTKVWHTAGDGRVRDSHAALQGETVPFHGVFSNGLAFPGDPAGSPEETIGCRCWLEQKIDFLAGIS